MLRYYDEIVAPAGRHGFREEVASTKAVGTAAVDYDEIVTPAGRHGFREQSAVKLEGGD